jgi:hypothetical protein
METETYKSILSNMSGSTICLTSPRKSHIYIDLLTSSLSAWLNHHSCVIRNLRVWSVTWKLKIWENSKMVMMTKINEITRIIPKDLALVECDVITWWSPESLTWYSIWCLLIERQFKRDILMSVNIRPKSNTCVFKWNPNIKIYKNDFFTFVWGYEWPILRLWIKILV